MNAKRQTVWLVSMLSLMVVLSAYYLFTEDVKEIDVASQTLQGDEIKVDTTAGTATGTTAGAATGTAAGDKKTTDTKSQTTSAGVTDSKTGTTAAAGTTGTTGKTDAQVLNQVSKTATSGTDFFKTAQMKRDEELSIQVEKWMTASLDSKKSTDEVSKALTELEKIQDQEARVSNLESLLGKDYSNALVLQENNKWKVVVQADKLEKSQGVTIVDLVMKELSVGADKISVQYVK